MKRLNYCFCFVFVLLTVQFSNANWLCQNDDNIASGNSITFSEDVDSEGCIFKGEGMQFGTYYFELKVENTDDSVAVGVTTAEALNDKTFKGFLYDEHLTDGEHVLRDNFGETIDYHDKFDTVGVIVLKDHERMDLYLIHAGVPLGLAFSIKNPPNQVYPAILVTGKGKITFIPKSFSDDLPLERSSHILDGTYELSLFKEGNKEEELKCLHKEILFSSVYFGHSANSENNEDEEFMVSFNNGKLSGLLSKDNGKWQFKKDNTNAAKDGSQASECVKFVGSALENVQSFEKTDSKVVISGIHKSFEAKKIKGTAPQPVTENVFDDNNRQTF